MNIQNTFFNELEEFHISYHDENEIDKKLENKIEIFYQNLENTFKNEYKNRFQPLIHNNKSEFKILCIIWLDCDIIGIRIFKEIDGKDFDINGKIIYGSMLRIIPQFRNKGIGKHFIIKTNKFAKKFFNINRLYGESIRLKALSLYNKLGVKILEPLNLEDLELKFGKEYIFKNDIKYIWTL